MGADLRDTSTDYGVLRSAFDLFTLLHCVPARQLYSSSAGRFSPFHVVLLLLLLVAS
jgi:hypothetical protein